MAEDLLKQVYKVRLEVIHRYNLPAEARRKSASDMGFKADFLNERSLFSGVKEP